MQDLRLSEHLPGKLVWQPWTRQIVDEVEVNDSGQVVVAGIVVKGLVEWDPFHSDSFGRGVSK
jgi:hypothetical protein